MSAIKPVFRIFDYNKAKEFYIDWLGFTVDWEHKPDNAPLYMQISRGDAVLHLSEHHGDCSPGAKAIIENVEGLKEYHQKLLAKNYKFNRPGLEQAEWNNDHYVEVIDPFGNRLVFSEPNSH